MRISSVARILLGLGFVVFAMNYFVPFLPPQEPPPSAMPFLVGFAGSGMLTLVKVIELGAGLLLLSNRFVPLALALLAPILVGIVALHALVAPAGIVPGLVLAVLEIVVAWSYRHAFAPMLQAKTAPSPVIEKRAALDPIPAR